MEETISSHQTGCKHELLYWESSWIFPSPVFPCIRCAPSVQPAVVACPAAHQLSFSCPHKLDFIGLDSHSTFAALSIRHTRHDWGANKLLAFITPPTRPAAPAGTHVYPTDKDIDCHYRRLLVAKVEILGGCCEPLRSAEIREETQTNPSLHVPVNQFSSANRYTHMLCPTQLSACVLFALPLYTGAYYLARNKSVCSGSLAPSISHSSRRIE
ncbi:hypothetical protein Ddc_00852 [Ditylenchus destructor]|nr:hypothetical protein Ddc_00852 [Ditylenchus destructor]